MSLGKVHVIGGGFSGLTIAYYLLRDGFSVDLFESSGRLGGLIGTEIFDWGAVETAANGLLWSPLVGELFEDLNLEYADLPPEATRARYIYRERPERWPLKLHEDLRLVMGLTRIVFRRSKTTQAARDLTARQWVSRHLGESAFDYLIGPALQGIMGTDEVSAELMIQYFKKSDYDRNPPRIMNRRETVKRRGTVSPKGGMGELIAALAGRIGDLGGAIHLNTPAEYRPEVTTVVAVPAPAAAMLLVKEHNDIARRLAAISYLPLTSVTMRFAIDPNMTAKARATLHGFGCLFPRKERFHSLGVLFSSSIFDRRTNGASHASFESSLETWLIGGIGLPAESEDEEESDESLIRKIQSDRARLLNLERHSQILNSRIIHWPHALPHYNVSLSQTLRDLPIAKDLYFTGNYLGRIGLGRILSYNSNLSQRIRDEH